MPYNLLVDDFAPFRLRSGKQAWLTVADIVVGLADDGDYPVEPDWPRPDFNIATYELLIGLFSVALAPNRDEDWRRRWRKPPSPDDLRAALEPLRPAFDLDGDGPRFMQEAGLSGGDGNPIESLLIDTPGANGQKKNADLLTHRDRYPALSLPAAAMALYALQAYAPAGGAGIRTSLRGGGPLTALVIPTVNDGDPPVPLWRKVWANVPLREGPLPPIADMFPWLKGSPPARETEVHEPDPGHPQAFFGMPRRIRLVFKANGRCSMTGLEGPVATAFQQKPSGINYGVWKHPLTPYARQKAADEQYSVKPKAGRFGYRDWIAATIGDGVPGPASLREPAAAVVTARSDRGVLLREDDEQPDARIRVGGWAMNNMEAMAYLVAEEPLHLAPKALDASEIDAFARRLAAAGDQAHGALRGALRQALFSEGDKPSFDTSLFRQTRDAFYGATDDDFHDAMAGAAADGLETETTARTWLRALRRTALRIFDNAAPAPVDDAEKALRVVKARARLVLTFAGWGKDGGALFGSLHLPPPEKAEAKAKRGKKEKVGA